MQDLTLTPAPKLAVNTTDFWRKNRAAQAFRLMRDISAIELERFFVRPPNFVRMALVQPTRDVVYLEKF